MWFPNNNAFWFWGRRTNFYCHLPTTYVLLLAHTCIYIPLHLLFLSLCLSVRFSKIFFGFSFFYLSFHSLSTYFTAKSGCVANVVVMVVECLWQSIMTDSTLLRSQVNSHEYCQREEERPTSTTLPNIIVCYTNMQFE